MSERLDLVVLGGGTGGLVCAMIAAETGARVALVERARTGGDCLWTGCVPSKTLIATAALAHGMRHADDVGLQPTEPRIDLRAVMAHVRRTIAAIEPHDSPARLRAAGVQVIQADGRFAGPGALLAGDRLLRFRAAIIATGSRPALPPIPGLSSASALTSDTIWDLERLPDRLAVLGGGPIGCELSQAFARLGARVTLVEMAERLLAREEPHAGELIAERLREEGVEVRLSRRGGEVRASEEGRGWLVLEPAAGSAGGGEVVEFDQLLVAGGREPRTVGIGLEHVGVELDQRGAIRVDERLRTTAPGIYAVGDVTGLLPFTHVAAHHARVATPNALFHARGRVARTVPWVTFTDPEVARVGLTEAEARERWGERARISQFDYSSLDRAVTAGRAHGFAKLIGDHRGRLVGATVAAPGGGEAIAELTAWISTGARIDRISRTVHAYPTLAEGPARAADAQLAARYQTPRARAATRTALALLRAIGR